jgi:DNA polymerase-3 subunit gamma/tau
MPVLGIHDQAIMESRHLDVIEMDAASHNGVDDIRQINDAIRYSPVSARYKVYILDEVHMLSTQAFNALLKTLEEPPPHAKFIFATTEIREVPITVLSRCQRFDLRRVDAALLVKHLEGIAQKEKVEVEPAALALIARAAEGSVRDSLSLLDQAIAHAAGAVRAEDVRQMLGLADRVRIVDLFEALMKGDMAAALKELREQYDIGADPAVILTDLAEFTHFVTRVKVVPSVGDDVSLSEAERVRGRALAAQLSMRVLSRAWQMLLKGIEEVKEAPRPLAAAEMMLVRLAYAADLPTPDEVVRSIGNDGGAAAQPQGNGGGNAGPAYAPRYDAPRGTPRSSAAPAVRPVEPATKAERALAPVLALSTFAEIIALAADRRDIATKTALERDVRLVRCEEGRLELALEPSAPKTLINDLSRKLSDWTGKRWMVVVSAEQGVAPVKVQNDERVAELKRGVRADPLVQAVLERFPGAEIISVSKPDAADLPPREDE